MKIRIYFSRDESVKYLGHLDVMRYFQRCFIRAGILMEYSGGFSPHQKLSFARPLSLGMTCSSDLLDAQVKDGQACDIIKDRLNAQMARGFNVSDVRELSDNDPKAMAAVCYAGYTVIAPDTDIDCFLSLSNLKCEKKTKSGSKETDIRPLVKKLTKENIPKNPEDSSGYVLYRMILTAGAMNNLRPDILMQEIFKLSGRDLRAWDMKTDRTCLLDENMKRI